MIETRRLFFALCPDESVRRKIQQAPFPRLKPKMTPSGNWHMTLVFLGPTTDQQQRDFEQVAASVRVEPFTMNLDISGKFIRAGVAWFGCRHPHASLVGLQSKLAVGLREARPEHPAFAAAMRPYCPHVTLYRHVKKSLVPERIKPVPWPVDSFGLIESRPSERPVYRVLNRWYLAN